jgi:hypothetical protein
METIRELFPTTLGHLMCPPACNSRVSVRVWAVRRDVPVSLVPRIVGLIPTQRKMGTVWLVYIPFRFCLDFLGYAFFRVSRFTLQGL